MFIVPPCLPKQVRTAWYHEDTLLTANAKGRGLASGEDGRRILTDAQRVKLSAFIFGKHEEGVQIFRQTVAEGIDKECGRKMSNLAVGRLLFRLGYKRRRGRIKFPPLTETRLDRIRRFLVEFADALRQEDAGTASHRVHG